MNKFWSNAARVIGLGAEKRQMNLALIIPLVIFVFTVLAWEQYVSSDLLYNRLVVSNTIIILGALFSTSVGFLIWSLERNIRYVQRTKRFFDNIIKSTIAPLFVIDAMANIKTINKAALNLLGYQEGQLLEKPVEMIM